MKQLFVLAVATVLLASCGGTKVVEETPRNPLDSTQAVLWEKSLKQLSSDIPKKYEVWIKEDSIRIRKDWWIEGYNRKEPNRASYHEEYTLCGIKNGHIINYVVMEVVKQDEDSDAVSVTVSWHHMKSGSAHIKWTEPSSENGPEFELWGSTRVVELDGTVHRIKMKDSGVISLVSLARQSLEEGKVVEV
jgi:hypothetical protein